MFKKRDSPPPRYREVYAPQEDMTRPCGIKCCKIFLIVLNFIFLLSGFAILGLGVWMQLVDSETGSYMEILNNNSCDECISATRYFKIPYVLMFVGAFVAALSFLGCCGACAESTCLLCVYSLILVLILIAEIVSAVLLGIYKSKMSKCLECSMQHQVRHSYNRTDMPRMKKSNETDLLTLAWDTMQQELKCCGATGPLDYKHSNWYNVTKRLIGTNVPPTCCSFSTKSDPDMSSRMSCQSEANHYDPESKDKPQILVTKGCHEAFLEWLETNITIALCILTAVVVLQILCFIAACLLLSRIRSEQSKHYVPPGYYPPNA